MKKLKLSLSNMEGVEVLTREQLKKVMGGLEDGSGGDYGDPCKFQCKTKQECKNAGCGNDCSSNPQWGNFCWWNPFG